MNTEEKIIVGYRFDRNAVWERMKDRKAVYLDMMVWIVMADDKPAGRAIKAKLRNAVQDGKVFCPLSQSLLWELHKQEFSKLRTGALMEELSLNVCFSRKRDVFTWELEQVAKRGAHQEDVPSSRKMLFTSIIGHVAPDMTITFDPKTPQESIQSFSQKFCQRLDGMGLTEFLKLAEHDPGIADRFKNMAPPPYQEQAKFFKESLKGNRAKVQLIEEQSVVKNYILPVLDSLPDELTVGLAMFFRQVPKDKYGGKLPALLAECPALQNHIEAMTRNSEDHNRKDRVNDFFDLEMMAVPLAYSDVFVTEDTWVRNRFLKPGGFLKRSPCQLCETCAELESWLDAL